MVRTHAGFHLFLLSVSGLLDEIIRLGAVNNVF
jgi:hypothetical protein